MSEILCPNCNSIVQLSDTYAQCESGHSFPKENGVYHLISESFGEILYPFLEGVENYQRIHNSPIPTELLPQTPYIGENTHQWNIRRKEWEWMLNNLPASPSTILNYGSWNGWLSNRLVDKGHSVTAISEFRDEHDGLGSNQHYTNIWTSLLMDTSQPLFAEASFDGIVLNYCFPYHDQRELLKHVHRILKPRGTLFVIGLSLPRDPDKVLASYQKIENYLRAEGKPIGIRDFTPFLTRADLELLNEFGFSIYPMNNNWIKSTINRVLRRGSKNIVAIKQL